MKKTIKVNLGGVVFQLDEDAYDLLRSYLDRLESRFGQQPGGSEILNDIEVRMAELFGDRLTGGREVVNLADAREVTAIMGDPAEIGEEEEPVQAPSYTGEFRRRRRFYRDPDNQVIGGVCSGLGAHFNIDPVFIRIIFVLFTLAYGSGILVYLVLWLGMPQARTSAEKLEMHGEEINISNIERKVRQDYDEKEEIIASGDGRRVRGKGAGDLLGRMVRVLGRVVLVFVKIIMGFVAFVLLAAGIALLAGLVAAFFGGTAWFIDPDLGWGGYTLNELVGLFLSPGTATLALIALIILVLVPVVALIIGFFRLLFNFRFHTRAVGWSAFGLWFIALILLAFLGTREAVRYASESKVEDREELMLPAGRTLNVTALPLPEDITDDAPRFNYHSEFWVWRERSDSLNLVIRPRVTVEASRDSLASIEITRISRGPDASAARRNARGIEYHYTLRDTLLELDPVFKINRQTRFNAQEIKVTLKVPVGTVLYLDPRLEELLYAVRNTEDTWSSDLVGKEWVMTPEGLTRVMSR